MVFGSLSCNAFAGNFEPLPDPPDIAMPTASTTTPIDMAATTTLDGISSTDTATVMILVDLNIRDGPGLQYTRIGFLSEGISVPVIGVEPLSGWLKIQCPDSLTGDECWVSGGAEYVSVDSRQDLPTVQAPATPTAVPPTVDIRQGLLAYLDDGVLFVAGLDLAGELPRLSSDGSQVTGVADVQQFAFSPDGRRIAFVAGNDRANRIYIVNVDGSDQRALVLSSDLPVGPGREPARGTVLIDDIQWLPEMGGIAFNTNLVNPSDSSSGQEDLWTVTLDGELDERFPAGEGGGLFVIEPDGRVLLSRANEIIRADLRSHEQDSILRFQPINTASEYIYYPQPQITGDGSYTSIPATNPWLEGAETTLWHLPADGPAREIGRVVNVVLEQPVIWSFDGSQTAFLRSSDGETQSEYRLFIGDGEGNGAIPYAGGTGLVFYAWQPEGDWFLYSGAGFHALGRSHVPPQQFLMPTGWLPVGTQWVTGDSYLVIIKDLGSLRWEIRGANQSGEETMVTSGSDSAPEFAVWYP